jgi:acyl-ACP thioesterase
VNWENNYICGKFFCIFVKIKISPVEYLYFGKNYAMSGKSFVFSRRFCFRMFRMFAAAGKFV